MGAGGTCEGRILHFPTTINIIIKMVYAYLRKLNSTYTYFFKKEKMPLSRNKYSYTIFSVLEISSLHIIVVRA